MKWIGTALLGGLTGIAILVVLRKTGLATKIGL